MMYRYFKKNLFRYDSSITTTICKTKVTNYFFRNENLYMFLLHFTFFKLCIHFENIHSYYIFV